MLNRTDSQFTLPNRPGVRSVPKMPAKKQVLEAAKQFSPAQPVRKQWPFILPILGLLLLHGLQQGLT